MMSIHRIVQPVSYLLILFSVILMSYSQVGWAVIAALIMMAIGITLLAIHYFHNVIVKETEHNLDFTTDENGRMELVWESSYESGNHGIDTQHRKLFKDGNNLISAIYGNRDDHNIETLLDALIDDIETHFASEETVLERKEFEDLENHRNIHQELLQEAYTLRDEVNNGVLDYVDVVNFFIYDLILNHILDEDRKYFSVVE